MATTTAALPASRNVQRLYRKDQSVAKSLPRTAPFNSSQSLDLCSARSLVARGGVNNLQNAKVWLKWSGRLSTQDIWKQRAFRQLRCTRPSVQIAAFNADRSRPLPDAGAYRDTVTQRLSEEESLNREREGGRTGAGWRRQNTQRSAGPVLPDTREFLSFERNLNEAIDPEVSNKLLFPSSRLSFTEVGVLASFKGASFLLLIM